MQMRFIFASRNLFHDRVRFIATMVGIVFSIVLVAVQLGLFLGFEGMITIMIDHASADLWIIPNGTKCFEDPPLIDERQRFRAISIPEVTDATAVVVGYAQWRLPSGATTPVFMVGSGRGAAELQPWNLIGGDLHALSVPDAVAVDQFYFERLETTGLGDHAEIHDQRVRITAVTKGIQAFTVTPYVFASLEQARRYVGIPATKASYFLLRVSSAANIEDVRNHLRASLSDAEVLTPMEFHARSRSFWLFGTGAGFALFGGALLGMIVGTVIVAQTLYSSTKDHLSEFATLRAMGSSRLYLQMVIILQSVLSAVIGFSIAAVISIMMMRVTAETPLPIVITPTLMTVLFVLTVVMCMVSATSAIVQLTRVDPVTVFTQ